MLLPRELIYRERRLEEFLLENTSSLFRHIYEVILREDGLTPLDEGCYEKIADTLNTVCYICTDAMLQPPHTLATGEYVNYIMGINPLPERSASEYAAIVLNCVKWVFRVIARQPGNEKYRHFPDIIARRLRALDRDQKINVRFSKYCATFRNYLWDKQYVTPRPIDDKLLKSINWRRLTNGYNLDRIEFIVSNISKDDDIKIKVIESIRNDVRTFGSEEVMTSVTGILCSQLKAGLNARKETQPELTTSESTVNSDTDKKLRLTKEVTRLKEENSRLTEEVEKLRKENSRLQKRLKEYKDEHNENYYFCDFVRRYMNSNKRKTVETRKEVRKSINDIMTHLKMSIPRELQAALNQFDDEHQQKEMLDVIGKTTEALLKLASKPQVGTFIVEQNNNGVPPEIANEEQNLLS